MGTLFCGTELAERIERAEASMIGAGAEAARQRSTDDAQFVIPIAGGPACFAGDGSPLNKVVGLGFGGVPDDAALDEIETAFAARGTATQIESATRDMAAAGATRYVALCNGEIAGSASVRLADGVALFTGAATAVHPRSSGEVASLRRRGGA